MNLKILKILLKAIKEIFNLNIINILIFKLNFLYKILMQTVKVKGPESIDNYLFNKSAKVANQFLLFLRWKI